MVEELQSQVACFRGDLFSSVTALRPVMARAAQVMISRITNRVGCASESRLPYARVIQTLPAGTIGSRPSR
jgi:hypothetical protein